MLLVERLQVLSLQVPLPLTGHVGQRGVQALRSYRTINLQTKPNSPKYKQARPIILPVLSVDAGVKSGSFDGDLTLALACFRSLGQHDRQYAVSKGCFDFCGVNAFRKLEISLERAVAALG